MGCAITRINIRKQVWFLATSENSYNKMGRRINKMMKDDQFIGIKKRKQKYLHKSLLSENRPQSVSIADKVRQNY
jgi:hypothetical protein